MPLRHCPRCDQEHESALIACPFRFDAGESSASPATASPRTPLPWGVPPVPAAQHPDAALQALFSRAASSRADRQTSPVPIVTAPRQRSPGAPVPRTNRRARPRWLLPTAGAGALITASLFALWMWEAEDVVPAPGAATMGEPGTLPAAEQQPAADDLALLDSLPFLLGALPPPELLRVDMLEDRVGDAPAASVANEGQIEREPAVTAPANAPAAAPSQQPSPPATPPAPAAAATERVALGDPAALAGSAAASPAPPAPSPATVPPSPAPDAAPPAVAPRAAVQTVVSSYARAVESRDIARLRGVYPGLSDQQQAAWERFFGSVRDLKAELDVQQLDVSGSTAEATITGAYAYESRRTRRSERMPVSFQAVLTRGEGGEWRLSAIR